MYPDVLKSYAPDAEPSFAVGGGARLRWLEGVGEARHTIASINQPYATMIEPNVLQDNMRDAVTVAQ
jgi:hypothetical protein